MSGLWVSQLISLIHETTKTGLYWDDWTKTTKTGKVVQLSSQIDIFGKIATIQQSKNVNFKDVFCCPLRPVRWSIAHGSYDMIKTSKYLLMTELEKGAVTDTVQIPRPFVVVLIEWQ